MGKRTSFFLFFQNFSTLLRQFFQLWSCHGHFPTLQLPAHVCSNFQHSISNGSKVMDNSSFDCLMLKGQGVQQELCTVYTAKGQGVHLLLLYLPVRQLCLQGGGGGEQWMDAAAHSSVQKASHVR